MFLRVHHFICLKKKKKKKTAKETEVSLVLSLHIDIADDERRKVNNVLLTNHPSVKS